VLGLSLQMQISQSPVSLRVIENQNLTLTIGEDIINYSEGIETVPVKGVDYTYSRNIDGMHVTITLKQYNPLYGETDVVISVNNMPLDYSIKLYTVGLLMKYKGTLVIPERFAKHHQQLFNRLFLGKTVLPVKVVSPSPENDEKVSGYQSPSFVIQDRLDRDNNTKIATAAMSFFGSLHFKWEFKAKTY